MDSQHKVLVAFELQQIKKRNSGMLTPRDVVNAAANPKSILHQHFTWSDEVAAHRWREEEARQLIRSVKYTVEVQEATVTAPYYVRDPSQEAKREQGYRSLEDFAHSPMAKVVFMRELTAARATIHRAISIGCALHLSDSLLKVEQKITRIIAQAERDAG